MHHSWCVRAGILAGEIAWFSLWVCAQCTKGCWLLPRCAVPCVVELVLRLFFCARVTATGDDWGPLLHNLVLIHMFLLRSGQLVSVRFLATGSDIAGTDPRLCWHIPQLVLPGRCKLGSLFLRGQECKFRLMKPRVLFALFLTTSRLKVYKVHVQQWKISVPQIKCM